MFPSRIDPRVAAEQQKRVEGNIPSSLLQRLREAVSKLDEVVVDLSFYRDEMGRCRVTGSLQTAVEMQCQRCLQDFPLSIETPVDAAVVWSDDQARQLPAELEPWVAEDQLDLVGAIEDGILLSLPIMPTHELGECNGPTRYSTEAEQEKVKKPFAGLEVLKKSSETNT